MFSSTCFNYNYIEFVGYETCNKLIWTSGEGLRNTDTTRKQVINKSNMNKKYHFSTLGFGCSPHKDTNDILSEDFVSHRLLTYSPKYNRGVLRYINKVKSRHYIGIPK